MFILALFVFSLVLLVVLSGCLRPKLPAHIPWVGYQARWPHGKLIAYTRSIWDSHTMLDEGYKQFSRNGKPFVFANLFTGAEILLPTGHMDWLHDQPETLLSSFEAHREFMRADWTFLHPTIFHEHVFETVIKTQLTRQLDGLMSELVDEIKTTITSRAVGSSFELVNHADWKDIVLQTVSRVYVGLPLCRDREYLKLAATFNDMSMLVAGLIGMVPTFLRPVLAPLFCLRDRLVHAQCAKKTSPLIEQRIKQMQNGQPLPHDLVTWAVQDAFRSGDKEKRSVEFLAARVSMMNFVSIDSTSITIENVLYDILAHPHSRAPAACGRATLLQDLQTEVDAAFRRHDGKPGQWKSIINDLPLLDACLKESFRLNNFISRTNVRKVLAPEGIIVPGVGSIPQGTNIGVALWGAHHDNDAYEDAHTWRMSRWLENAEPEKVSVFGKGSAKVHQQYLPFGYRRHACPGRFFALRIVKLLIAHMLLDYDLHMTTKSRPWNPWLGVSRGPPMGSSIRFTRRSMHYQPER